MTQPDNQNHFATHCSRFAMVPCALLNRDGELPADGWYQIVSVGEFRNRGMTEGKEQDVVQVCDRGAFDAMATSFANAGTPLLVDFEHFSHDPDKATRAAGWIKAVEAREDGLYAQIDWTNSGLSDVEGKAYRFISPEFDRAAPLGGQRYRPVRLSGAGLTNRPALTTLKPLTNRSAEDGGNQPNKINTMDYKASLIKVLGLPDTATDEDISAAIEKTGGKNAPALAQEIATANRNLKSALEALTDADMSGLDHLDEETRKPIRETLIANRAGGLKLVAALRKGEDSGNEAQQARIFNRKDAKPPKTAATIDSAGKAEDAKAARIFNRANEIMTKEKVPWNSAFNRAEAEAVEAK